MGREREGQRKEGDRDGMGREREGQRKEGDRDGIGRENGISQTLKIKSGSINICLFVITVIHVCLFSRLDNWCRHESKYHNVTRLVGQKIKIKVVILTSCTSICFLLRVYDNNLCVFLSNPNFSDFDKQDLFRLKPYSRSTNLHLISFSTREWR